MSETIFYTVLEVAEMLKVKKSTIQRYVRDGKLQANLFGREYRISKSDLDEFLKNTKIKRTKSK